MVLPWQWSLLTGDVMAGVWGGADVRYLGVKFQGSQFVRLSLLKAIDEFLHAVDVPW